MSRRRHDVLVYK